MNAVILHGGSKTDPGLEAAHSLVEEALVRRGVETRTLRLEDMKIRPCTGCFGCWLRTPGQCVQNDDGREIARSLVQSDVRVLLTPITFGGYSVLKTALDRMVPTISPLFTRRKGEIHHRTRYPYAPVVLGVGWQHEPDEAAEDVFCKLVERNALNMSARAFGAVALTAAQSPDEQRSRMDTLVKQTKEGS